MANPPPVNRSIKRGCLKRNSAIKRSLTAKSRPVKSSYLGIFIMDKHRSRLRQEKANLTRRINLIDKELASLDKAIAEMGKDVKGDIGSMSPLTSIKSVKEIDTINEPDTINRMQLEY
ncbi:MAG: hypothetical protein KKE44_20820 [Proteobacteria bacterium]|nr:hypothetical protein [Pseudomonadota bacterium]MBU1585175.1 hypothetical protein [Pseudomonadota bacterium]MBU2454488.1 hypothetical protein [Pseudomonadota bacterium]MBU2629065.1 hypothetical protein [Pseudomonadota bacterium]